MARFNYADPVDLGQFTVSPEAVLRGQMGVQETEPGMGGPEALGSYGEVGGQLTGMEEDSQLGLDWTPVSDEQAQRWMEEKEIYDAGIELEMLKDKMLNSRRDLIDDLYEGKDPSLRSTKPIIDELRKMEMKSFMESIGDPEEMTPEQKLRVAIAKVEIGRTAEARVESDKQKDVATLNDAVSEYNTGIKAQMSSIQGRAMSLRELHAQEDEAMMEAAQVGGPKEPSPVTWTTATKQLSRRFGKEDPMGNIIITPELAGMNRIAQRQLVKLKKQGVEPLEAINIAEEFARHIDSKYWKYADKINQNENLNRKQKEKEIKGFNKQFRTRYGYMPRIRPR